MFQNTLNFSSEQYMELSFFLTFVRILLTEIGPNKIDASCSVAFIL